MAPHRSARQAPAPVSDPQGPPVLAPRPDVVDALLGARAELAACVRDDAARADMWAVHAAMGGLLAAELAGARWPLVVAVVRLAWRCCAVLVRWGVAAELETRRRRLAAGHGEPAAP